MSDLNQLLRLELDWCRKLIRLTLQLERSVDHRETDHIEFLLAERGKVLTRISGLQERVDFLTRGIHMATFKVKGKARALADEIRDSVQRVMDMDRGIAEKLKGDRELARSKLGVLRRGRRALKGYGPLRTIPRFLDRRL